MRNPQLLARHDVAEEVHVKHSFFTLNMHETRIRHVLRHTCGKRMLDAGAQLTEVAAILGHTDLNMTRRYTQPGAEDLHRAVGRTASKE